jgi:UPF0176 protein
MISRKELKKRMLFTNELRLTISFYKYFFINNPQYFRDEIYKFFFKQHVLGRVYVAHEGINAQISVFQRSYHVVKEFLYSLHPSLRNLRINKSLNNRARSFWLLCVKVKKKIVQDGICNPLFDPNHVGEYIQAEQVNAMLNDNETIFVDMRNSYEYAIGHFEKAIEIKSMTFRQQLKDVIQLMQHAKDKKIVLYCTGGIRCEKASAWMIFNGFKHVYHIEGGIINYVRTAKKIGFPILFKGSNFVFDHRMCEKVSDDVLSHCRQCKEPSDNYVNCNYDPCHLLFIQCKYCSINYNHCCSVNCMKKNIS